MYITAVALFRGFGLVQSFGGQQVEGTLFAILFTSSTGDNAEPWIVLDEENAVGALSRLLAALLTFRLRLTILDDVPEPPDGPAADIEGLLAGIPSVIPYSIMGGALDGLQAVQITIEPASEQGSYQLVLDLESAKRLAICLASALSRLGYLPTELYPEAAAESEDDF